jgi:hypothetical protein
MTCYFSTCILDFVLKHGITKNEDWQIVFRLRRVDKSFKDAVDSFVNLIYDLYCNNINHFNEKYLRLFKLSKTIYPQIYLLPYKLHFVLEESFILV